MSEIFVEEENTVYELDEECMKRKEKMKQEKERSGALSGTGAGLGAASEYFLYYYAAA